jgi:hypothetical protein
MDIKSPMKLFKAEADFILTENSRKKLIEATEKDTRRQNPMYKSPIEIIYQRMQTQVDDDIVRAVQSYNINVDRDELIKALNYDRDQYRKGFEDGKKAGPNWISVKERMPDTKDFVLVYDGSDIFVAWYENEGMSEGWHSYDNTYDCYTPIIAWMPLPAPYTTDHQEESNA